MKSKTVIAGASVVLWSVFLIPPAAMYLKEREWILSPHLSIPWDRRGPVFEISAGKKVCQQFVWQAENLSRIELMLRRGGGKYNFQLLRLEGNNYTEIYRENFVNRAQNYSFQRFDFPSQFVGDNTYFQFCISGVDTNQSSIGIFRSSRDLNGHALFLEGEKIAGGNSVFQLYSRNEPIGVIDFFKVLLQRLSQYKPWYFKMPYLGLYFGGFYLLLFIGIYKALQDSMKTLRK